MRTKKHHPWNLTPRQAIALQKRLAAAVDLRSRVDLRRVRTVAGADVSYARKTDTCYAAVIVWDLRRGSVLVTATAERRARFPYVPGLLSFREAPALIAAFARLAQPVDMLLIEGQGYAHPRRLGLASHLGVLYDVPTVGCAKSRLVGVHRVPGRERGRRAALGAPVDGGTHFGGSRGDHRGDRRRGGSRRGSHEVIGAVLRTRTDVAPLFVSVGHAVGLDQACRLVLRLSPRFRQPEPLRRAHQLANALRREREGS